MSIGEVAAYLNSILGRVGFKLVRCQSGLGFLDAKETVAAARARGMTVSAYVAQLWNQAGELERVMSLMAELRVFSPPPKTVCEIGPGTGQFVEQVLKLTSPERYEVYETAPDWRDWLTRQYPVVAHAADGHSLASTPTASTDLVHAHGVFVYLPFLNSMEYMKEITRVVRPGGHAVFDILSEGCFRDEELERWLSSDKRYPTFLGRDYLESYFARHSFALVASFFTKLGEGRSEYLVLRRVADQ